MAMKLDDEDQSFTARTLKRSVSEESGFLSADPDTLPEVLLGTNSNRRNPRSRDDTVISPSTYFHVLGVENNNSSTLAHESEDNDSSVLLNLSSTVANLVMECNEGQDGGRSTQSTSARIQRRKATLEPRKRADESNIGEVILPTDTDNWDGEDVEKWVKWCHKEFQLWPEPNVQNFPKTGKELAKFTIETFRRCTGNLWTGRILYAHFQYRKHEAAGIPLSETLKKELEREGKQTASYFILEYVYRLRNKQANRQWGVTHDVIIRVPRLMYLASLVDEWQNDSFELLS